MNSTTQTTVRGNTTSTAFVYILIRYLVTGVVFCTSAPAVPASELKFNETSPTVVEGAKITLSLTTTPFQANPTITFTSGTEAKATVTKIDDKHVEVTGVDAGTSVITATDGTHSATVTVTVTEASA